MSESNVDETEEEALQSRIRTLSNEVWDGRVEGPDVDRWLKNFTGEAFPLEQERLHALHLLSNFNFFNVDTVRSMLKSVYRDLFRYELIQRARNAHSGSRDFTSLNRTFLDELAATRFLGMGNPSESGAHLLYYFRQINALHKNLFIHQHQILEKAAGEQSNTIAIPNLKRLVFIDDLMGSGQQAAEYSEKLLKHVRAARGAAGMEIWYFTLFARPAALDLVRSLPFDRVETIHEMDDAERAFSPESRVYRKPPNGITLERGKQFATKYGERLFNLHPLGYKDGQLLLGFEHNVPDNCLPIFWLNEMSIPWEPVFPRFHKVG